MVEFFIFYIDSLFCDCVIVIVLFINDEKDGINFYIIVIILSVGWSWYILLYGRSGNGYVYFS